MIEHAAWPAIAGDRSVSGSGLLHNVLNTEELRIGETQGVLAGARACALPKEILTAIWIPWIE
jgi:hypothetical protein